MQDGLVHQPRRGHDQHARAQHQGRQRDAPAAAVQALPEARARPGQRDHQRQRAEAERLQQKAAELDPEYQDRTDDPAVGRGNDPAVGRGNGAAVGGPTDDPSVDRPAGPPDGPYSDRPEDAGPAR